MRLSKTAALPLALAPLFVASEALASGFMVRENSAESLGMIYAGNASRADEAATVFNNPAGMTHLSAPELEVGAAVVLPSIHFSGTATAAGTIPVTGTQGGNGGQITGIPSFFAVLPISPDLSAGLAVTVPFGNTTNYKSMFVGRYSGIKTRALSADINPNIAYRITDKVSIGAGISAQWLKVEQSAAVPQFLIAKANVPDTVFLFNGVDWAVGYNVGLLLTPNATTRLGFTYRSGIDHKLHGSLDFDAKDVIGAPSGRGTASGVDLPGTAAASFTHDFTPQWSASAELQYNMWSSFKQVVITSQNPALTEPEYYNDSWMVSAGAVYRMSDQLRLRAGIGWDGTPVPDKYRTVGVPDADRLMLGIGAGYSFAPGVSLDFAYSHYFALKDATVTGSVNSVDPLTQAVVLSGTFHNYLDYLAVSFRYQL